MERISEQPRPADDTIGRVSARTSTDSGLLDPNTAARVRLRRTAPPALLDPVVERFWSISWRVPTPLLQPVLPHPCVNLAFGTEDAGVHGPERSRSGHTISGTGWVFGVKMRPGALVAMGVIAARPWVGARAPIPQVFGPAGVRAVRAVDRCEQDEPRGRAVQQLLSPYLPVTDPGWTDFTAVMSLIVADRRLLRIGQLAAATGWSHRTLQRRFRHYLGLSPAWVLRRLRLHQAADKLMSGGDVDLADLAGRLGYADQAHLTRAFSEVVGMSPGAYVRWCRHQLAGTAADFPG